MNEKREKLKNNNTVPATYAQIDSGAIEAFLKSEHEWDSLCGV